MTKSYLSVTAPVWTGQTNATLTVVVENQKVHRSTRSGCVGLMPSGLPAALQETKIGPDKGADGYPMNHCVGYIGVFFVDNVQLDENRVFSCDVIGRR